MYKMSIYDDARALGQAILDSDESKKVLEARVAFDSDKDAQALIAEYTEVKTKWDEIMQDTESDKSVLTQIGETLVAKEKEIKEYPATYNLLQAETEFGAFVNSVFGLVKATIQGETVSEGGCDPSSCSSCGGGCH